MILDEFSDLKVDLARKRSPVTVSYKLNVAILNILWQMCSGRKLHSQQQEFQTVYECIDKVAASCEESNVDVSVRLLSSCPALPSSPSCPS